MRVAFVSTDPGIAVFGHKGASIHVREVVRGLRRRGAEVTLFTTREGGAAPPDLADVPVRVLPRPPKGTDPAAREIALRHGDAALAHALEQHGPFDLVYERYALWSHAAVDTAARWGVPAVVEVNAPLVDEQARHRELVDRAAAERIARTVFTRATVVTAVSGPVAAWVRDRAPATTPVAVVPNGVDPGRFADVSRVGPDEAFTVGFVGSLKPWHGVDTLVRAVAGVDGAHLLVVGDGPQRDVLTALVAECGMRGRTTFTGAVGHDAVPALLGRMHVATAPYGDTDDDYFSPLKIYEYLAAGVTVVASDVGQVRGALGDGARGRLCPPGDTAALAAALRELRDDPGTRAHLADAGRRWVRRHRTWDGVVDRVLDLAGVADLPGVAGVAASRPTAEVA